MIDRSAEGINAMVLKGRAIFRYYAVPHHRYSYDLIYSLEKVGNERVSC